MFHPFVPLPVLYFLEYSFPTLQYLAELHMDVTTARRLSELPVRKLFLSARTPWNPGPLLCCAEPTVWRLAYYFGVCPPRQALYPLRSGSGLNPISYSSPVGVPSM